MRRLVISRLDPFCDKIKKTKEVVYLIENNGLITKEEIDGRPVKKEYQITKEGIYVIGSTKKILAQDKILYPPETFTREFIPGYCLVSFSEKGPRVDNLETIISIEDIV